mgnify:FL=1|tara:strand:- start:2 stop:250 length:249 start_codon:yes stop_codon:yes gene_type:complete
MKKNRLIKALKKANTEDINKYPSFTIADDKGQVYVISTEEGYKKKMQEVALLTLDIIVQEIDDKKITDKLLKTFKKEIDDKK